MYVFGRPRAARACSHNNIVSAPDPFAPAQLEEKGLGPRLQQQDVSFSDCLIVHAFESRVFRITYVITVYTADVNIKVGNNDNKIGFL